MRDCFNSLRAFLILRWRVWRIIIVLFAPMALQTFDVRVKSAAAFERYFLRCTSAHFEKRLRQRRATIVSRLRQLCKTAFDGGRQTWPGNNARQLVCVFFSPRREIRGRTRKKSVL